MPGEGLSEALLKRALVASGDYARVLPLTSLCQFAQYGDFESPREITFVLVTALEPDGHGSLVLMKSEPTTFYGQSHLAQEGSTPSGRAIRTYQGA